MTDAQGEVVLSGLCAADGIAIGQIALETGIDQMARAAGNADQESAALEGAIRTARTELEKIVESQDELAADILEFQLALLEDDDLIDPIFDVIVSGVPAHVAWQRSLDTEIAEYRGGDDEYMAARAEDLLDLKGRVARLLNAGAQLPKGQPANGAIVVADDLTPSRFLELDWRRLGGAASRLGSRTSHVAILARARGVPLIVGLVADRHRLTNGLPAVLDAEAGRLVVNPDDATMRAIKNRLEVRQQERQAEDAARERPAVTASGQLIQVLINVDDPGVLDEISAEHCDGIGLTRTEFLFSQGRLPDEETQLAAYSRIVRWASGKPVTIRTLDAGGDKPIAGVTKDGETNPFLGVRGVRLSLVQRQLFGTQLRALARAAVLGPLKVMVPMVTLPEELDEVRRIMTSVLKALKAEGVEHAAPDLGMMVEVPAAALTADRFAADFYSIGSNDLVQYVTAAARDNPNLAAIADPANPAVLELIGRTVTAGRERAVNVSLCGDMASEPALLPALLDCGLRSVSVAPAQLGRVKLAISRHTPKRTFT